MHHVVVCRKKVVEIVDPVSEIIFGNFRPGVGKDCPANKREALPHSSHPLEASGPPHYHVTTVMNIYTGGGGKTVEVFLLQINSPQS